MPRKQQLTIKQLADLLAWRAFGTSTQNNWMKELQFIMGRNRGRSDDTIQSVLEDILRKIFPNCKVCQGNGAMQDKTGCFVIRCENCGGFGKV